MTLWSCPPTQTSTKSHVMSALLHNCGALQLQLLVWLACSKPRGPNHQHAAASSQADTAYAHKTCAYADHKVHWNAPAQALQQEPSTPAHHCEAPVSLHSAAVPVRTALQCSVHAARHHQQMLNTLQQMMCQGDTVRHSGTAPAQLTQPAWHHIVHAAMWACSINSSAVLCAAVHPLKLPACHHIWGTSRWGFSALSRQSSAGRQQHDSKQHDGGCNKTMSEHGLIAAQ